jgi:hypothetical protein
MLGDPSARFVDVYLPAGHDGEGLPLLVILAICRQLLIPYKLVRLEFEPCYPPDMPAVLRALASAENSIERWRHLRDRLGPTIRIDAHAY